MGFRPSSLARVSQCRGGALGGGCRGGAWALHAGGRLRGQRIRPGSPTVFPVPKWTGNALALLPSIPPRPSPTFSPRVSPPTGVGPAGCRNSSPPPATPQGCRSWRSGLYFCSAFPPSHSLRTCTARGGLGGQRIRPGSSAGSQGPKWAW